MIESPSLQMEETAGTAAHCLLVLARSLKSMAGIVQARISKLRGRELNPGLPRDRRKY